MSLLSTWGGEEGNRINDLAGHYTRNSTAVWVKRAIFTILWYASLWEFPSDFLPQKMVQSSAMGNAQKWVSSKTRWILCLKPLEISISPEDLERMQGADNNMFFVNHQAQADIPRTCELLGKLLWTHANTYFVMKPWVPLPFLFKAAWGIVLKRWRDLKKEKETGIIDDRWHLLNPTELPEFLEVFMKKPGKNIVLYSQWTRAKWKTEMQRLERAFSFNWRVIQAMQSHIDATPKAEHFCIAFDYRDDGAVRVEIKHLWENDILPENLDLSVNWFLNWVKNNI